MATKPPAAKRQKKGSYMLTLHDEPSSEAPTFLDTPFEVSMYLEDESGEQVTDHDDLPLEATLLFADEEDGEPDQSLLAVEQAATVVNGKATLRCSIKEVSMNVGNRHFCIELKPSTGGSKKSDDALEQKVEAVATKPIEVVKFQLAIDAARFAGNFEESEGEKFVFYKDEGGRDKCMTVPLQLKNSAGVVVTGRAVTLHCTLLYESGQEVGDQGVLLVHSTSQLAVDPASGAAELKIRIEEVSRNHRNRDFQIKIGTAPSNHDDRDVAADTTAAVTVRSKRNNPKRGGGGAASRNMQQHGGLDASGGVAAMAQQVAAQKARMEALEASMMQTPIGPDSMGRLKGSMENVLNWVSTTLDTLQRTQEQMAQLQQQANQQAQEINVILKNYERFVMSDLQVIVNNMSNAPDSEDGGGGRGGGGGLGDSSAHHPSNPNQNPHPDPGTMGMTTSVIASPPSEVIGGGDSGLPEPLDPGMGGGGGGGGGGNMLPMRTVSSVAASSLPAASLSSPARRGLSMGLSRQVSNSYFDDQGDIDDSGGAFSLPRVVPTAEGSSAGTAHLEEQVRWVVAKVFCTAQGQIGFPAFGGSRQLLGFYREASEPGGYSVHERLEFLPMSLAQINGQLSASNVQSSSSSLAKEINRNSKSVFERRTFQSLEDMKSAALFYHTSKTGSSAITSWASEDVDLTGILDDPTWKF